MIHESYSSLGEIAGSPFIVPVASFALVACIFIAGSAAKTRKRELESQERLAAIAKGLIPPPTLEELALTQGRPASNAIRRRANIRLAGIVLLGSAAGIILFFVALAAILQERDVLCGAAAGLIPLGIGIGFLVDARIQAREIDASIADTARSSAF
jgi:hypothetical protein